MIRTNWKELNNKINEESESEDCMIPFCDRC